MADQWGDSVFQFVVSHAWEGVIIHLLLHFFAFATKFGRWPEILGRR